mmetsp:Transcript_49593/g.141772  ORF Transcript_49593/g.141772 Transcript_49593/m.141772 type:complete len:240 (-) Transcript_49593:477-1196(-)
MTAGATRRADLKISFTRLEPAPANLWLKSAPEREMNGTAAVEAIARASRVFPQPGGPVSSRPLGHLAPSPANRAGAMRHSTISRASAFAGPMPATSSRATLRICCCSGRGGLGMSSPRTARMASDWPKMSKKPWPTSQRLFRFSERGNEILICGACSSATAMAPRRFRAPASFTVCTATRCSGCRRSTASCRALRSAAWRACEMRRRCRSCRILSSTARSWGNSRGGGPNDFGTTSPAS